MRSPFSNNTEESEVIEVSSQTTASQEPIATATIFTSTLSVKVNQSANKEDDKEKEEYAKFLEGFTKTRIKKYSEPFVRQPLDQSKVTDLKSSTEEEKFTNFSNSFTDSRRENFLKPIRKPLDKNVKKKDGLQVSSLKQENIGTNELLEKMFIKLKTNLLVLLVTKIKLK
ncbi:hypothetical protein [Rickettsia australis]|uniref:Uncharacterized protein n=1 Tax=Rickettsia australis (strain Cutlack) TaxID=1105110 RepID=H8K998_RICAC|nr:hypothetical protein [Rickettsia australis]AFC70618.1 hypothetical protein MC5_01045 [Rickettsia australis str. Cutlack]